MSPHLNQRQFELLSVACGAAMLAHIARLPTWLSFSALLLLLLRVLTRRRRMQAIGAWLRLPLTGLLLIAIVFDYGNVFGREAGSALAVGLLALKLLETEYPRDARVALGFAAFVLMSALLFTQTLLFTLALCLALILLLAALIALQPAPADPSHRLRDELRVGALLLAVGTPLALSGFVLVPRLSAPLWGAPGDDLLARTGLSDRMTPGSLSDLLIDDSPAMRVHFDGVPPPPPPQLYFRAIVLWDFDGSTWTRGRNHRYLRPEPVESRSAPIAATVTLEPTDQHWLPTLDLPIGGPNATRLSSEHMLVSTRRVGQAREYRTTSVMRYVLAPTLTSAERERALALPQGFDPKARALVERWRAERYSDAAIVRAALDLFHARFTYTLSPPPLGHDSIDDFLFATRAGFCEHYASAFTFLMRAAGIPARVVTGYQGGWWSETGGYLLVRQSDAHAWSEIWLDRRGWVRVDPTAAVSPTRVELGAAAANGNLAWYQASWLRTLRNRLDLVNRAWTESIVQFNALRQQHLLVAFGGAKLRQRDLLLTLAVALAAVLAGATIWAMRGEKHTGTDALDRAWLRLCRRLEQRGIHRKSNEGPVDYLARLRLSLPQSSATLTELVQTYIALRYGSRHPSAQRVQRFAAAVRRLAD
ncbi:MAG: DUF3488 and transglutaminase-like domain-containing protein [Rhodanobacteraceae bacterium]